MLLLVVAFELAVAYSHAPAENVSFAPAGAAAGSALYGVQRTSSSGKPLWRTSGCIDLRYDQSVDAKSAAILDEALRTWEGATRACSGPSLLGYASDDQPNVIIHRTTWPHAAGVAAMTRLSYVNDPTFPDEDGKITGVIALEFNNVDFDLVGSGNGKPVLDLLAVATHEVGHVLGLAHNCGTGRETWPSDHAGAMVPSCDSPSVNAATMFYRIDAGETRARSLEPGDVQGACSVKSGEQCERFIEGGCRAGRSPSWLVALLLLVNRRRRRRA